MMRPHCVAPVTLRRQEKPRADDIRRLGAKFLRSSNRPPESILRLSVSIPRVQRRSFGAGRSRPTHRDRRPRSLFHLRRRAGGVVYRMYTLTPVLSKVAVVGESPDVDGYGRACLPPRFARNVSFRGAQGLRLERLQPRSYSTTQIAR